MENFPKSKAEGEPKVLFRVTLMRHEETEYTGRGNDLTERGEGNARMRGEMMQSSLKNAFLIHSPSPRARATLEGVAQGAGLINVPMHSLYSLRQVDFPDRDSQMAFVAHYRGSLEGDPEKYAKEFHTHPEIYEAMPEIMEPKSHMKQRLYRSLSRLIRWIQKNKVGTAGPQILAVSHFEIITQFLSDVFNVENIGYLSPDFGETVSVEAFETENEKQIELRVQYNKYSQCVLFDTISGSILKKG